MTPPNALDALATQFKRIGQAISKRDYVTAGDLAHSGAHIAEDASEHALASEAAAYEKAAKAICRYCDFADKPKSRWSKANSNGKHFDEEGVEQYCDAWPIRQLAAPPTVTRDNGNALP